MKKTICVALAAVLTFMLTSCGILGQGRDMYRSEEQTITVNITISEPYIRGRVTIDFYTDKDIISIF